GNLYISTIVTPKTGFVSLVFRESAVSAATPGPGGTVNPIIGYYYLVDPFNAGYQLTRTDRVKSVTVIPNTPLAQKPATDFAMGVLAQGQQITLYVNGVPLSTITDAGMQSGGIGLCTSGDAIFRDVQVYSLKS
ncbi:MAG TPA: hypothetical protein VGN32_18250, partial [Ktedonobacterales bacterium]|nr:hypothetical protein [Ktedonobacterales bacterium]